MHLLKGKRNRSRSEERVHSQKNPSAGTQPLSTLPGSSFGSIKTKRIVASAYKASVKLKSSELWPSLAPELPTDEKPTSHLSTAEQLVQLEFHQPLVKRIALVESESGCRLAQNRMEDHQSDKRENLSAELSSIMHQEQMGRGSIENLTSACQVAQARSLPTNRHHVCEQAQDATQNPCTRFQSINPKKTAPWQMLKRKCPANSHQPAPIPRHRVPREPGEKSVTRSISLLGISTSNDHSEQSSADHKTENNVARTQRLMNRGLRTVSAPILVGLRRVSHRRRSQEILHENRAPIEAPAMIARLSTHPHPSPADIQIAEDPRDHVYPKNQMSQSCSNNSNSGDVSSMALDLLPQCDHKIHTSLYRARTSSTSTDMGTAQTAASTGLHLGTNLNGKKYQNLIGDHHSHTMEAHYPVNGSRAQGEDLFLSDRRPSKRPPSHRPEPTSPSSSSSEAAVEFQSPTHPCWGPQLALRGDLRANRVRAVKQIPGKETLPHEERMDQDLKEVEMVTCKTSTVCSTPQGWRHECSTHQKLRNSADHALTSNSMSTETIPCNEMCAQSQPAVYQASSTRSRADKSQSTMTQETVKTMRPGSENSRSEARRRPSMLALCEGRRSDEDVFGSEAIDLSPRSDSVSLTGSDSEGVEYETPETSPERSPIKSKPALRKLGPFEWTFSQFDGSKEFESDDLAVQCFASESVETTSGASEGAIDDNICSCEDGGDNEDIPSTSNFTSSESTKWTATAPVTHSELDDGEMMHIEAQSVPIDDQKVDQDDMTPSGPASPAKSAHAFPVPHQPEQRAYSTSPVHTRRPSALLEHCERHASPLQRRLMASGVQTVDRFVPSRNATPTKEALHFTKPEKQCTLPGSRAFVRGWPEDPFGPAPRRSLRMAEQYATVRHPPPAPRAIGMIGSRVREAQPSNNRAASAGTIWSVGSTVVTEGVASVTNGRGGRVTSGSNATHFVADFLRKNSRSEEEITHGRRLALAMDITPKSRIMEQSSPSSPMSSEGKRVWKDGAWKVDGEGSRLFSSSAVYNTVQRLLTRTDPATKSIPKKAKEVPVIPFRVLNAPSLRDDYYCSLLAYSPTVECLAVGLGPHVYLWSENRGPKNIPDSFTVAAGSAHVTSLSFSSVEGNNAILAIGRADGRITLWSPLDRDPRFDSDQPAPVSCVCFRPTTVDRQSLRDPITTVATEELLVGDEIGSVYYYSVEWPNQDQRDLFDWHGRMTLLVRITCHAQQICGMAWSPNGDYFATGGNDNQLLLFESKKVLRPSTTSSSNAGPTVHVRDSSSTSSNATVTGRSEVLSVMPGHEKNIFTLNAAVKAIAFAPWQTSLLAAGGGSNDRCIHFFHTLSGAALATIDCHAQVTSLVWSVRRREIAATFGFAQPEHPYRVAVFAWPGCAMVIGIPWFSEERALFAVAYPRGPSDGQAHESRKSGRGAANAVAKPGREGEVWYGRRTREEGCLVVATSDASIKFHEIWAERPEDSKKRRASGTLGGSQILEGECSPEFEGSHTIR